MSTTLVISWLALACASDATESGAPDAATDAVTSTFRVTMTNTSSAGALHTSLGDTDIALAPALLVVTDADFTLFTAGFMLVGTAFEPLAEDGDPTELRSVLTATDGVREAHPLVLLDATYAASPLHPGDSVDTTISISSDSVVFVIFMYGQSNDTFVATRTPVSLFAGTVAETTDFVPALALWDAGTEQNQEPGVGADQAPRQAAANTGAEEAGVCHDVSGTDGDGYAWPEVASFVSLEAVPE